MCVLCTHLQGCGIVTFATHDQAVTVLDKLHLSHLDGPDKAPMQLRWAENRHQHQHEQAGQAGKHHDSRISLLFGILQYCVHPQSDARVMQVFKNASIVVEYYAFTCFTLQTEAERYHHLV